MKKFYKSIVFRNRLNVHVQKLTHKIEPIHMHHDFFEFVYVIDGCIYNEINGKDFLLTPGSVVFLGLNQTHKIYSEGNIEYINILFTNEFLKASFGKDLKIQELFSFVTGVQMSEVGSDFDNDNVPVINLRGKTKNAFDELVLSMLSEYEGKEKYYEQVMYYKFNEFVTRLARHYELKGKEVPCENVDDNISKIVNYIKENYDKKINLNEVADKFFYNRSHLSRRFKSVVGLSFNKFIQREKVHRAIEMLNDTNLSLEEISEKVGYENKRQFYTIFKNNTGMTPGQVRRNRRNTH